MEMEGGSERGAERAREGWRYVNKREGIAGQEGELMREGAQDREKEKEFSVSLTCKTPVPLTVTKH